MAACVVAFRAASGIGVRIALVAWVLLNLVGGGILSVLPLAILPFVPEQSGGHYAAHVGVRRRPGAAPPHRVGAVRTGHAATADAAPR